MNLLTKSLFTTSLGCPRKLYYATHPDLYDNTAIDDDFLRSLAEGGIQVGALARHYYFSAYKEFAHHYIETKDHQQALLQTQVALRSRNVVVAEAAFEWNGCFVRADILVKRGQTIQLVEVKSSSLRLADRERITETTERGEVNAAYRHYIYDLAFQKYVVEHALGCDVQGLLMLINSEQPCDIDGLNQMIRINTKTHEVDVEGLKNYTPPTNSEEWLLLPCDMTQVCDAIIAGRTTEQADYMGATFTDYVDNLLDSLQRSAPLAPRLSTQCKGCEFRSDNSARSGYHHCWRECAGFTDDDFQRPHILELWGGKGFRRAKQLIEEEKYFLADLTPEDYFVPKDLAQGSNDREFNGSTRRQMQIEKRCSGDNNFVLLQGINDEMAEWRFPLHFIDFETSTVAIPFTKGRYPYETIAFQYSHHRLDKDGALTHSEWISTEQVFPNFEFVRALKHDLDGDCGTIFRYSHHENSVLNQIADQLATSNEPDREILRAFIHTITHDSNTDRVGERNMVDLCDVVVRYYYDPSMGGSNSIKVVLPAVLHSKELQRRYERPYREYVDSPNYKDFDYSLINYTDAAKTSVGNPYKYLPVIGAELGDFDSEERINNGGLANANYAKLQYDGLTHDEKSKLKNALLRYCELDTMAMVLIYHFFKLHAPL